MAPGQFDPPLKSIRQIVASCYCLYMNSTRMDGLASKGNEGRKAVAREYGEGTAYDVAVELGKIYWNAFDTRCLKTAAKVPCF